MSIDKYLVNGKFVGHIVGCDMPTCIPVSTDAPYGSNHFLVGLPKKDLESAKDIRVAGWIVQRNIAAHIHDNGYIRYFDGINTYILCQDCKAKVPGLLINFKQRINLTTAMGKVYGYASNNTDEECN